MHLGPGFGSATASFHNTAASRRRAVVQIVPEPSTRPPAHVPMCPERRESMGAAVQASTALHCSLALRRCATAAKHVWTSRTALLRCSRLAARSRPTTRSTRGSWRGLTHDLSVLATRAGSRRKQRGALRTHDSAGEAPPQTKHKGELGGSQKNCGRQRLSVSLAVGERNTKGRTDVHPQGCEYWRYEVESADSTAARRSAASTRGLGSIEPC